jgi:hypothetical protein
MMSKKMTKAEFAENEAGYMSGFHAGRMSTLPLIEKLRNALGVAIEGVNKQTLFYRHCAKLIKAASDELPDDGL